ncbi:unnamed protein product, partial [Amoebophrya sp. A120]|eukprot:GSA120T00017613001.1
MRKKGLLRPTKLNIAEQLHDLQGNCNHVGGAVGSNLLLCKLARSGTWLTSLAFRKGLPLLRQRQANGASLELPQGEHVAASGVQFVRPPQRQIFLIPCRAACGRRYANESDKRRPRDRFCKKGPRAAARPGGDGARPLG